MLIVYQFSNGIHSVLELNIVFCRTACSVYKQIAFPVVWSSSSVAVCLLLLRVCEASGNRWEQRCINLFELRFLFSSDEINKAQTASLNWLAKKFIYMRKDGIFSNYKYIFCYCNVQKHYTIYCGQRLKRIIANTQQEHLCARCSLNALCGWFHLVPTT